MTKEDLKEHLRLHALWLADDPAGKGANLSGANLYRADLSGADLSGADLSGANLSGANLYRADLSGADLYRADLSGADLSGANLYGADLSGANLYRADLSGANLQETILAGKSILSFQFEKHTAYFYGSDEIVIGCERHTVKEWLDRYQEIGKKEGYSEDQILMYGNFIKSCAELFELKNPTKKEE
jgi:uncharacterized protein YjbI with pentapeptide repeats